MKKIWISAALVIGIAGVVAVISFSSGTKAAAGPIVVEDIQYPFEKGGGLVHVSVEDLFIGVGMLTGERKKDDLHTALTGSVNFEMATRKGEARIQVDGIRLIERMAKGQDGRVFEAAKIYDEAIARGLESELQFPKEKGALPFVWENAENDCIFFTFTNITADVTQADLVITYNGKFPGKKHAAYYEDRLPVKRKAYLRSR